MPCFSLEYVFRVNWKSGASSALERSFFQQCFFLCCSDKEQNFYDTGIPGNYLEFKLSTEAEICIMFVFCL